MRVLLTSDSVGGVWTYTQELATGLLEAGCSVSLINVGPAPRSHQRVWCTRLETAYPSDFSFNLAPAPLEWMQDNDGAFTQAAAFIEQSACNFRADVFHSSQFCFGALDLGIAKVVVAHSDVLSWANLCQPDLLNGSDWLTRYRMLVEAGLQGADTVVTPSQWMLDALSENFDVRRQCVIYNGRSLARNQAKAPEEFSAITAGRVSDPGKNLQALRDVRTSVPVTLAGDDSVDIDVFPLLQLLTVKGHLAEDDLIAAFCRASVYLYLSIYEPFGLSPLEAALCGCAILANDTPSAREGWGEAALYFSGSKALEQILPQLETDRALLEAKRSAAYERALHFSGVRMVQSYLKLYTELTAEWPRTHEVLCA